MFSQLGNNTLMQLAGKIAATLIGLAVAVFMTRGLGPTGFGHYTTVIVFLQTFAILTDFGLTMMAGRALGAKQIPSDVLLSNLLSFRTVTSAIVFSLAPLAALVFPYPAIVKVGVALTSLAFFLASLTQSFQAVFQATLKSGYMVMADFWGRIVLLVGTIVAARMGWGVIAYLIVYTIASLVITVGTLFYANKLMPFKWQIDLKVWRLIWLATWPVALTIALNLIYLKADTLILAVYWPAHAVGLYGAAYKVLEVLLAVPAIIGGLVLPLAARYLALNDQQKLRQLFQDSFDAMFGLGLAIVVGGTLVGGSILIALAGVEFAISGQLLFPLSIATAFIFLGNVTGYFIFALGKQKQMIPLYALLAILSLVIYFTLIPRYAYWAAAWGHTFIEGLMSIGSLWLLGRWGFKPTPGRWPKIVLATGLLALGLLIPMPIILRTIAAVVIYVIAIWYLKLIPTVTAKQLIHN
jgi:O-antigen/teichoic acid export membrane protein